MKFCRKLVKFSLNSKYVSRVFQYWSSVLARERASVRVAWLRVAWLRVAWLRVAWLRVAWLRVAWLRAHACVWLIVHAWWRSYAICLAENMLINRVF